MRLIHTHKHTTHTNTKHRTHYLTAAILAIVAIAVFPLLTSHNAHAASGTSLSLSPASQSVTTGSTMTIAIMLNTGGDSINTVQSVFTYSASHYTLVSITPSASFSSFPDTLSSGSVEFSAATSTPVTGTAVTVATVVLQSTGTGTSALTLASVCGSGDYAATCSAAYDSTTSNNDLSSVANGSYTVNPVVVPLPSTPTGVSASANSATSVTVKWTGSTDTGGPGVAGYYILRGGTQIGSVSATAATSYTDTTAAADTTYNYTVEAYDSATPPNVSAQSSAANITTPKAPAPSVPSGVTATANSSTSVTVKWTGSTDTGGPGLAGYDVYRNGTLLAGSTSPTYTDTTVAPNTAYSYTIAAYDTATPPNVSAQSSAANVTTPKIPAPSTPTGVSASANSATSVTVKWTGSTDTGGPGLAGYYILRGGTKVGSVNSTTTSYTDTTAVADTAYSYTVEAYDTASTPNVSAPSSAANVTTPKTPAPSVPSGVTATANSSTSVTVKWTGSTDTGGPGVAGYYVIRGGTTIAQVSGLSYTDTTVAGGTTYSYTVEAYDTASTPNVSAPSSAAKVTTPSVINAAVPTAPTAVEATAVNSSQINLSWTASTANVHVEGYYVYRSTHADTAFALVATTTTTSYGDTDLSAGTTYYYYVVAYDSAGKSSNSATVNAVTKAAVTTTTATIEGKVTSTTTRRPIVGAFVRTGIRGTSEGAATSYTNSSGNYVLDTIKANTAQIYHYTDNGYRETRVYENFPAGVHTLNASLTPKPTHQRHRR